MYIEFSRQKITIFFFILAIIVGAFLMLNKVAQGQYVTTLSVSTGLASNISQTSAILNGVINPSGNTTSYWFEYGVTSALGNIIMSQSVYSTSSVVVSKLISNLSPNTNYYFRIVAQNRYSNLIGSLATFTTLLAGGTANSGNLIGNRTVNISLFNTTSTAEFQQLSCITLVPTSTVSPVIPNKSFTFVVAYKNNCEYNLSNVFLKVILPSGVDFVSTNYPIFNRDTNGITYSLGAIPSDFQSAVSLEVAVGNSLNSGDSLMFSLVFNFNDDGGNFHSLSAYLNLIVGQSQEKILGATIVRTVGDLFKNWIFDLVLIIATAFIIYWLFFSQERKNKKQQKDVLEEQKLAEDEMKFLDGYEAIPADNVKENIEQTRQAIQ
jgi:hypothetical protein